MKGEASFVELLLHLVNGAGDASACQRGQFQKKKKSQQAIGLMFFFFLFSLEVTARLHLLPDKPPYLS